jgi:acyl carrier protein
VRAKEAWFERVREVLKLQFDLAEEEIRPSTLLADDLDLDSVDLAELLVLLEEATGLALGDADPQQIRTVQHVVDLIADHVEHA